MGKVPADPECVWIERGTTADGLPWLSYSESNGGYLLRFHGCADFFVAYDGNLVEYEPAEDLKPETLRHLLLDQVLPAALSASGRLLLHASAVLTPAGGVGFLGAAGAGKSTIATSFCRAGHSLISDDCLLLEECRNEVIGISSYSGVRLWPDAVAALFERPPDGEAVAQYSGKKRVGPQESQLLFHSSAALMRRLYVLNRTENASDVKILPLAPATACIELVKHAFCLGLRNPETLKRHFLRRANSPALTILRELEYPSNHENLDLVHDAVLADVSAAETCWPTVSPIA